MLNLSLISVDYQNANFGIYAFPSDETSDYKIESFDISVKFDPAVISFNLASINYANGVFGLANVDAISGLVELGGYSIAGISQFLEPLIQFEATMVLSTSTVTFQLASNYINDSAVTDSFYSQIFFLGSPLFDSLSGTELDELIFGFSGNDILDGGLGNDTLDGGLGNDTLNGGAGIDTFTVGSGTDTISDLGNGGADVLIVAAGAIANARMGANWVATAATSNSGTATINANNFNVNLAAATGTSGWNVSNSGNSTGVTLIGSANNNVLTGGLGADTLNGGLGNDTLVGGLGNDTLTGGLGNDTLTGGTGIDTFIFNTTLGTTNLDRITDFSVTDDTIWLENTGIFTAFSTLGTLGSTSFHTGTAAGDGLDRIIYNSTNGSLFYDADGTGSTVAVQFATLATGLVLTNADFWVI